MHNHYGIYRSIRNASWQCLFDTKCCTLPVDIKAIARHFDIKIVKDSILHVLEKDDTGLILYTGNHWIISYDDSLSLPEIRYTIAHELGHYFLGHDRLYLKYAETRAEEKAQSEKQADLFAVRLLCPACVIAGLGLHTAEEIAAYCCVPMEVAKQRAKRMETLYKRQKFFTDPLEERVYNRFEPYILKALGEKGKL